VETRTITLTTADGPMDLYEAVPEGKTTAAVIVIQEAFGVNEYVEDVTRRVAGEGYHAVAPALFHRSGSGTAPYDDFSKVIPLFEGMTDDGILMDVDATVEHLRGAGFTDDKIGIVGFCMGGRVTFLVSVRRSLGAGVGFYGGGIVSSRIALFSPLIDEAGQLKTPWLGLFGDQDESIPVEDVERIRADLDKGSVDHDVVRYAEAGHGFHCDRRPDHYDEAAAADGWQRALAWFSSHLAG
jgi:carboxymethylenebutenolidase